MQKDTYNRYATLVNELGMGKQEEITAIEPLTGGVASDIVKVTMGQRVFCLKCALKKLKVEQYWQAPLHRNAAEYAWLQVASRVNPEGSVKLYGESSADACFAMEYIEGKDSYLWKTRLLAGEFSTEEFEQVGEAVGRIHSATSSSEFSRDGFNNHDDFFQLRLDPYLNFTATQHPAVADTLHQLVDRLSGPGSVLIHGDVSPKNILFRGGHPVLLDAECATMGDPCFDVAFCLNHFVLKAVHLPRVRRDLLRNALAFWASYAAQVSWEDEGQVEARVCALMPALILARIDGKSPVEYLTEQERDRVRSISLDMLVTGEEHVDTLLDKFASLIGVARQ